MARYIGLISGTSMDGIDAALVSMTGDGGVSFDHGLTWPLPEALQRELHALCQPGGADELRRMMGLDHALGEAFAAAAEAILRDTGVPARAITAVGSHGQTLRHYPEAGIHSTLQVGDPNIIAERTGITTVADFRRRDMAAGGEGAPLAPAFHQFFLGRGPVRRAVLNLGGIANLTLLDAPGGLMGFDCGPANTLLDLWTRRHLAEPLDRGGRWAATGRAIPECLEVLLADPYLERLPPKSTGREYFNLEWLETRLGEALHRHGAADIQATLVALTAESVARALKRWAQAVEQVLVCGGGVHNPVLMKALEEALPDCRVASTAQVGLDPDYVEAAAFAWLAHRTLTGEPGNVPGVTGARHAVVLGTVYPGGVAAPRPNGQSSPGS
ncbi:MAG: anhydro-N-acetylmuramic acid kinase [Gammaproteobacteria bacterium]|nr:anhydro-N-acetylmuramic acid kinase [Gammaproteobacteria bacterium]